MPDEKSTPQQPQAVRVAAAQPAMQAPVEREQAEQPPQTTTDDRWVKPSSVPRDRVRTAARRPDMKSESEKAREVFERAMSYGIDEAPSGVVETRMLRASEVRDLLGSAEPVPSPPEPAPAPSAQTLTGAGGTPRVEQSSRTDTEEMVLGRRSAIVRGMGPEPVTPPPASAGVSETSEFRSSRYTETDVAGPAAEPPTSISRDRTEELTFDEIPVAAQQMPSGPRAQEETTSVCPNCGSVIHIDRFEYPTEIYKMMGEARLRQARFFLVQGNGTEARRICMIAAGLFSRAADEQGLAQVDSLLSSLAR
ncbi:MAG: hypothetical protein QXQ81_08715 [Candidatus Thorarchaeota archaeon]